jgi:hypothetical protein
MRTLRWSLPLVLLFSTLLAGCSLSLPGTSTTPTTPPRAQLSPAWTAVLNQIGPNGEVSLATALQAYSLVFGPLPGVPAPASDGGLIGSGTLAVEMILQHYHDLTPAQQQAVLQRLGLTVPASAAISAPGAARVAALAQAPAGLGAQEGPATTLAPTPTPTTTQVVTDPSGMGPYRAMINAFIPQYDSFLAFTYTLPTELAFDTPLKPAVEGWADPVDAQGGMVGTAVRCRIYLNPVVNTYSLEQQRFVIGHELFHCYQAAIMGTIPAVYAAPKWLIEGSAQWAGATVSGATAAVPEVQATWFWWLGHPDIPLFKWSWPAMGFFSLLNQVGISPWKVLPAMLLSQVKGSDNLTAYQAGTQSAPQKVLDAWASSYERAPTLGSDWDLTGPGMVPASTYGGPPIQTVTLGNGPIPTIAAAPFTELDEDLTAQVDVLQVHISGTSRLHDSASFERVTSADGSYCTKQGGCACPPGSAYQGPALPQLTGLVHLAATGGPQGANGTVSGLTLQQFCKKQKPTSAPTITQAFCQSILSIAEANQFMQPPIPATAIRIDVGPGGGSCHYEYKPYLSVVTITFLTYAGATDSQSEQQALAMAASEITTSVPGAAVSTTQVNDIPDVALFIAASATQDNITIHQDALDVIYGRVLISCANFEAGSASDASQLSGLHQVCKQVVNVIDP